MYGCFTSSCCSSRRAPPSPIPSSGGVPKTIAEGCAAGLVPGTEDVTLEVDVDLATCDFAALVAAAGAQLPPRHRAVAFHFQGKAIGPGSAPLAAYGVRRGDTVRADVRREPFELARTGPPLREGDAELVGDGARE